MQPGTISKGFAKSSEAMADSSLGYHRVRGGHGPAQPVQGGRIRTR